MRIYIVKKIVMEGDSETNAMVRIQLNTARYGWSDNDKGLQSLQSFLPVRSSSILRSSLHGLGSGVRSYLP